MIYLYKHACLKNYKSSINDTKKNSFGQIKDIKCIKHVRFICLTLEVPEILHYLEVPSGVKLTLLFIDAFYIF